jgi:hypothetical protein
MKNKNLYIGVGIALVVVYFLMRKKKSAPSDATTKSADAPTLSEETKAAIKLIEGKGIMPPTTSTCGCGSGQTPCPNVRCARQGKDMREPIDLQKAFQEAGITEKDFDTLEAKYEILNKELRGKVSPTQRKPLIMESLQKFADENKISLEGYLKVLPIERRVRRRERNKSGATPTLSNETETFAFNLTF